jgi:DNA-binding MarR family transcriptional regulator
VIDSNNKQAVNVNTEKDRLIEEINNAAQKIASFYHFAPGAWLELNLTIMQLKCLLFIDYKGSTNFKQVADVLGVTPPSVTGIVDRLVEQGLISREENAENRRMQILRTTEKGRSQIEKLLETRRGRMTAGLVKMRVRDLTDLARIAADLVKAAGQCRNNIENDLS